MTNIAARQNKTPTQQVIKIKHYKLKASKGELNSTNGNHLCGLLLGSLPKETLPSNFQSRRSDAIADRDILLSQIALLCNGRTDFNDIDLYRGDEIFVNAYRLKAVASESRDWKKIQFRSEEEERLCVQAFSRSKIQEGAHLSP